MPRKSQIIILSNHPSAMNIGPSSDRGSGFKKGLVCLFQSLVQIDLRAPAQAKKALGIDDFARGSIRLAGVIDDPPAITDGACNSRCQIANRDFYTGTQIDDFGDRKSV